MAHIPSSSSPSSSSSSSSSSPRGDRDKTSPFTIAFCVIAIAGSVAFIVYYSRNLEQFVHKLNHLGYWGNFIFVMSYFPAGLPFALISYYIPLSLSAGFLYKEVLGLITAMVGSVSASMFGFWITRTFCRSWIEEKIKASARLSALLLAMEYHSFKITLMVRFLPLPFGLQNALCAMTSISASKFLISSSIGLLPENMLLIYFGSTFESISETTNGQSGIPRYEKVLLGVAVLVTCAVFLLGRKMLDATLAMARAGNKKTEDVDMQLLGAERGEAANGNGKDGDEEVEEIEVSIDNNSNSALKKTQSFGKEMSKEQAHNAITPIKLKSSNSLPAPSSNSSSKHKKEKEKD